MDPLQVLLDMKEDLRQHRQEHREDLVRINEKLDQATNFQLQIKGAWLVVSFIGSGVISLVVAILSVMLKK